MTGYGPSLFGNRLVRTRMLGGVGAGGEKPPATRLYLFGCSLRILNLLRERKGEQEMITADRYLFLYESNTSGANLAPIDFSAMQKFETGNCIDVSDSPTATEMKRRLTPLLMQHQG